VLWMASQCIVGKLNETGQRLLSVTYGIILSVPKHADAHTVNGHGLSRGSISGLSSLRLHEDANKTALSIVTGGMKKVSLSLLNET